MGVFQSKPVRLRWKKNKTTLTDVFAGRLKSKYIKSQAVLPGRCWEMTLLFKDGFSPRTFEYARKKRKKKHWPWNKTCLHFRIILVYFAEEPILLQGKKAWKGSRCSDDKNRPQLCWLSRKMKSTRGNFFACLAVLVPMFVCVCVCACVCACVSLLARKE